MSFLEKFLLTTFFIFLFLEKRNETFTFYSFFFYYHQCGVFNIVYKLLRTFFNSFLPIIFFIFCVLIHNRKCLFSILFNSFLIMQWLFLFLIFLLNIKLRFFEDPKLKNLNNRKWNFTQKGNLFFRVYRFFSH